MIRWRFSVMFSRRFAVMSFRLMLFALCSVLHKVSSVPQGISDKKHNFVLCRAIFYLCGNRFRFLCFVISYKKAQKSRPSIKAFCLYTGRPAMPSPISCSESFIQCYFVSAFLISGFVIITFCSFSTHSTLAPKFSEIKRIGVQVRSFSINAG